MRRTIWVWFWVLGVKFYPPNPNQTSIRKKAYRRNKNRLAIDYQMDDDARRALIQFLIERFIKEYYSITFWEKW